MATATAILELNNNVLVVCPHCTNVHSHDAATTARLIAIPAQCDAEKSYVIGETMKSRNLLSALNTYKYETERKRNQYYRKKATTTAVA
jgi:hypothetical protein